MGSIAAVSEENSASAESASAAAEEMAAQAEEVGAAANSLATMAERLESIVARSHLDQAVLAGAGRVSAPMAAASGLRVENRRVQRGASESAWTESERSSRTRRAERAA